MIINKLQSYSFPVNDKECLVELKRQDADFRLQSSFEEGNGCKVEYAVRLARVGKLNIDSRSSAAALINASVRQPGKEDKLAWLLKQQAPYCHPNRLMIKLADQVLSLEGKLIDAVAYMGEPDENVRPQPFVLNVW
jgi:hypothetical protein